MRAYHIFSRKSKLTKVSNCANGGGLLAGGEAVSSHSIPGVSSPKNISIPVFVPGDFFPC